VLLIFDGGKSTKPTAAPHLPKLVIVGQNDEGYDPFSEAMSKGDSTYLAFKDQVIFKGFVPYEDLPGLYSGAKTFLFPSLYEGFGIPVLESIAFNKKILISKGTVCEEIAGEFGISVDGNCVESISMGYLLLQNQKPKTKHSNHKSNLYFESIAKSVFG